MHGLIYSYLNKFVEEIAGEGAWSLLLGKAGIEGFQYSPMKGNDDEPIQKLVMAASEHLNMNPQEVLQAFGRFLGPQLIKLYRNRIHPDWKTFELLLAAEKTMHETVRRELKTSQPPVLDAMRSNANEMHLIYNSERKLCFLAEGLLSGISTHYEEEISFAQSHCVHRGDPFCVFEIKKGTSSILPVPSEKASVTSQEKTSSPWSDALWTDLVDESAPTRYRSNAPKSPGATATLDEDPSLGDLTVSGETDLESQYFFLSPTENKNELGAIGSYRIKRLLGEGAMGMVFAAVDTRLKRAVALKVMRPQYSHDKDVRARFERESRTVASLTNRHIVTVYDVGQSNNVPYLVMERLYGKPLSRLRYNAKKFDFDTALNQAYQMATGLQAAHEQGLIHRDIKPGNIWVEKENGNIKLLDFGLAKSSGSDVELTSAGTLMGTPAFMSPEQSEGGIVDYRTDMFSLGAVYYWMLTGKSPFGRKTIIGTLSALANDPVPDARDANPNVPQEFAELVKRLLQKNVDERLITAKDIMASIDSIRKERLQPLIDRQSRFPDQNPNPVFRVTFKNRLIYANPASKPLLKQWNIEEGDLIPEPCSSVLLNAADSKPFVFESGEQVCRINVVRQEQEGFLSIYGFFIDDLLSN